MFRNKFLKSLLLLFFLPLLSLAQIQRVDVPAYAIEDDSIYIQIHLESDNSSDLVVSINGSEVVVEKHEVIKELTIAPSQDSKIEIISKDYNKTFEVRHIPGWFGILPPVIAIFLALIFKEVILALFAGIFTGAVILYGFAPAGIIKGFYAAVDRFFLSALSDSGNLSVIIFSVAIGGMVSVISKNGGMQGIVDKLARFAQSARSTQLVTWFLGIAIFFDDYANTLIVGNTMRPVTDKHLVSREKLSYIVDSTAAPIAAIAFITTWIGAELGYIADSVQTLGIEEGPYLLFLNSLSYAYYPIFTLFFMFLLLYLGKDFGPMYTAERRARTGGGVSADRSGRFEAEKNLELQMLAPADPSRAKWQNGLIPVLTVVLITILGLLITGLGSFQSDASMGYLDTWRQLPELLGSPDVSFLRKLGTVIGAADSYQALLWASFSGVFIAITMSVSQKILSLTEAMESLLNGFKTMVPAMLILILAWSLSEVTTELKTAEFITEIFNGNVPAWSMPVIIFVMAAIIAFSTGSSWGTMAILYPLALPATWALCLDADLPYEESMNIFHHVIAVVLAGSVLGDHCSPISDTTIMSSLASQCHHVDHVNTQLPYALAVGGVSATMSLFCHLLPMPSWVFFLIGMGALFALVKLVGKDSNKLTLD